jgi:hypothetical protein
MSQSKILASSFVSFSATGEVDLASSLDAFGAWLEAHAEQLAAEQAATAATTAAYDTAARAVFAAYAKASGRGQVPIKDLVDAIASVVIPGCEPAQAVERNLAKPLITAHIESCALYRTGGKGRNGGVSLVG